MQFHINIAFWELLRKRSPQVAELVQPQFTDHRQTFDVRLFEVKQKRLDQPTDLEVFMERIDKIGKRIPTRNETESSVPPKPLCATKAIVASMAQQYFGYYLYSVLYTADPTSFDKAL